MKTSSLKVHLTGGLRSEQIEPFAKLIYGNVEIQIPYYAFRSLNLDLDSEKYARIRGIFDFAKEEMEVEMRHDMNGHEQVNLQCWHRDNPQKCSMGHFWLDPVIKKRNADYVQTDAKKIKE